MRLWVLALCVPWLAACGSPKSPPQTVPAPRPEASASKDEVTMNGIDLYRYDTQATFGTPRKPRFWLHAETGNLTAENTWLFERSRGVIYAQKPDAQDIVFEAPKGRVEEREKRVSALLEGGVVAQVGTMRMELQDMTVEWLDREGEAWTDAPVHVLDGATDLHAATLRLSTERQQFVLTRVTGVLDLKAKKKQEAAS